MIARLVPLHLHIVVAVPAVGLDIVGHCRTPPDTVPPDDTQTQDRNTQDKSCRDSRTDRFVFVSFHRFYRLTVPILLNNTPGQLMSHTAVTNSLPFSMMKSARIQQVIHPSTLGEKNDDTVDHLRNGATDHKLHWVGRENLSSKTHGTEIHQLFLLPPSPNFLSSFSLPSTQNSHSILGYL